MLLDGVCVGSRSSGSLRAPGLVEVLLQLFTSSPGSFFRFCNSMYVSSSAPSQLRTEGASWRGGETSAREPQQVRVHAEI